MLLLFYVSRLVFDIFRPDYNITAMFGGVGEGVFLTAAYLYYKKLFTIDKSAAHKIFKILLYTGIILAIIGLAETATGINLFPYTNPRFQIESYIRANSIFNAPEYFGLSMALCFFVTFFLFWEKEINPYWAIILSSLFLGGMIASLYRGIWLAFFAGLIFVYFKKVRRKNLIILSSRLVIIFLITISFTLIIRGLIKDTQFYQNRIENLENVDSRLIVYRAILKDLPGNLILGHGSDSVNYYLASSSNNTSDLNTPHNLYLSILYDNGLILSLIYFSWFIGFLIKISKSSSQISIISGAILITLLVTAVSMFLLPSFEFPFLIVVISFALLMSRKTLPSDMQRI